MPFLKLFFILLLTFVVGESTVIIRVDDNKKIDIKVKKDEKRLNKNPRQSSNRYMQTTKNTKKSFFDNGHILSVSGLHMPLEYVIL